MRKSVRTRDIGWPFRHSSRIMNLLEFVFKFESLHMHLGGE